MATSPDNRKGGACGKPQTPAGYDFEFHVYSREDRKTVAAILADNGYDVGFHKRKRTPTGKSVDYYIHATDRNRTRSDTEEDEA